VEFGPKRVLGACAGIKRSSESRGNAELGRPPVLCNIQVPRQRFADRGLFPNSQCAEIAHLGSIVEASIPLRGRVSQGFPSGNCYSPHTIFARVVFAEDLASLLGKALVGRE
jgi:hypothetical protein